jgi:ABC-type phosphate/phosphonate transport system substrate-binding protein
MASLLALPGAWGHEPQSKIDVLRIGTSGTLTGENSDSKEKAALETLQSFIQEETGLNNQVIRQKDWRVLTDQLTSKQLHLGVFQGYEFAWAQEQHPDLKPLAVAINVYTYPVAYVVVQRNGPIKDFTGLQGQSLALPTTSAGFVRLFLDRQAQRAGKTFDTFFGKVSHPENAEDALDDVVDGVVKATVADRATLESYKRRKPGRFNQLKEVARSQPFPPPVVAYYDTVLDEATLQRFRDGLLNAAKKEKGQTLLTLFRLTGFVTVPRDFEGVLAETRKAYPPPNGNTK